MKLRDLRELYEAPKSDLDDLDGFEDHDRAENGPMRAIIGFDPGMGVDSSALAWHCGRCGAHVVLNPPAHKAIFVPMCPNCDACGLCKQTYDEIFDPLVMKTDVVMRPVDGELVETKMNVCVVCIKSSEDKLREVLLRGARRAKTPP